MDSSEPILDLAWGDSLQLQMLQDGARERYSVSVIGVMHGISVMITAPEQNGRLILTREGQVFVARGFSRSRATAFTSRVLRVNSHPFPYVHLSYPERQQQVQLRASRRAHVTIGAFAQVEKGNSWSSPLAAVIGDISVAGMLVEVSGMLGEIGSRVKVTTHLQLTGMDDQEVIFAGMIQTIYEHPGEKMHFRYGISLATLDAQTTMILRAFVYEQLLGSDR